MKFSRRKCRFCRQWFLPEPHNAYHQHYCTRAACQGASRRRSHRKWLRNKPADDPGDHTDVLRVQLWRAEHPRYWRRQNQRRHLLMDLVIPVYELANRRIRLRVYDRKSGALQDVCAPQPAGGKWLLFNLGHALRDFIRIRFESWYHRSRRTKSAQQRRNRPRSGPGAQH